MLCELERFNSTFISNLSERVYLTSRNRCAVITSSWINFRHLFLGVTYLGKLIVSVNRRFAIIYDHLNTAQRPALSRRTRQSEYHFTRNAGIAFQESRQAPWRSAAARGWAVLKIISPIRSILLFHFEYLS